MQNYPLTLHHIFWRLEKLFGPKEVVTSRENSVHRYTYADLARRVYRLANALHGLGVRPGDRVGTLAWNNYRHLELYYAVPMLGAVLHTLNMRLFPSQLEFVIRDGADRFMFVDACLVPVLDKLAGKLETVEHIVVQADAGETVPDHGLGNLIDYEGMLAAERESYSFPEVDERAAAAMCYTSGTTGNPKGVVYTHRSQFLHAMAAMQVGSLAIAEPDVILPAVPMFHANCWGLPYAAGMAGAKKPRPWPRLRGRIASTLAKPSSYALGLPRASFSPVSSCVSWISAATSRCAGTASRSAKCRSGGHG